jgi:hypothetical protein
MDVGLDPLDLAGLRAGQRANVAARPARAAVPAADGDVVLV